MRNWCLIINKDNVHLEILLPRYLIEIIQRVDIEGQENPVGKHFLLLFKKFEIFFKYCEQNVSIFKSYYLFFTKLPIFISNSFLYSYSNISFYVFFERIVISKLFISCTTFWGSWWLLSAVLTIGFISSSCTFIYCST